MKMLRTDTISKFCNKFAELAKDLSIDFDGLDKELEGLDKELEQNKKDYPVKPAASSPVVEPAKQVGNIDDKTKELIEFFSKKYNPALTESFWIKFIAMCKRLNVDPKELAKVIRSESGFKPDAVYYRKAGNQKIPVAKGLNQLIKVTAKSLGMTDEVWNNYDKMSAENQLEWVEKFFKKVGIQGKNAADIYVKNFGGYNNPDGSLYAGKTYIATLPPDVQAKFQNPDYQEKAYQMNKALDKAGKGYINKADLAKLVS